MSASELLELASARAFSARSASITVFIDPVPAVKVDVGSTRSTLMAFNNVVRLQFLVF